MTIHDLKNKFEFYFYFSLNKKKLKAFKEINLTLKKEIKISII
jgi:hypothetical protein